MTVQDGVGGVVGEAPGIVNIWLDGRLCDYLMSQHIIGQKEKRDMQIYVDHISYMTLWNWLMVKVMMMKTVKRKILLYKLWNWTLIFTFLILFSFLKLKMKMNIHAQMLENIHKTISQQSRQVTAFKEGSCYCFYIKHQTKELKVRSLWQTKVLFILVSRQVPGNILWLLNWHLFVPIVSKTRLYLWREQNDNKGSQSAWKHSYFRPWISSFCNKNVANWNYIINNKSNKH